MRYFLIYNPVSGQGRNRPKFNKVLSALKKSNVHFQYILTSCKNEAIKLAKDVSNERYDAIVSVGGDGTICEVITGLMQQPEKKRLKLGVIHVGTSPDFNKYHKLPVDLEQSIDALLEGKTKRIDIGEIAHLDLNHLPAISYFGSSVNIGIGPDIASKSNGRYRRYLGDFLGTLSSTLISFAQFKQINLKATIDGKEKLLEDVINLTVGKDNYLASGMRVPLDIHEDDGILYCLSIQSPSKIPLLVNLWRLYAGNILDYGGANLRLCREVDIEENEKGKVEFDGDFRGYLPANIKVIPKALELIVK